MNVRANPRWAGAYAQGHVRAVSQALFLQDRLIAGALDEPGQAELRAQIERLEAIWRIDEVGRLRALEDAVVRLLGHVRELGVAVLAGDLESGELVTLTQDFYIRRDSEDRGSFKAKLDSDRGIIVDGRFSTSRLIGEPGQSETFGHHHFTMLGYTGEVELDGSPPHIELRPLFIGWLMLPVGSGLRERDDRREVSPQQIDQFAAIGEKRAFAADRSLVRKMSEEEVRLAFADIIGEPFVFRDRAGEASDLFTNRLTMRGEPLYAAFAFKGRAKPGKLDVAGLGKRGDQALRLAHEPADLLVVQHHSAIVAPVRNLLSAIARMHGRRFMTIDGDTTAVIFREYGKLRRRVSP